MSKPESPEEATTPKSMRLWLVALIGFGVSCLALFLTSWYFSYQETLEVRPIWWWVPPLTQAEMFGVLRNSVTAVAALGVGVTLFLSYRRQHVAERTLEISAKAQLQAAQTLELTRKQHASESENQLRSRYSTAAQQIGDQNASLSVAGIIAMGSIADAWNERKSFTDRDDCIRMLVAALPPDTRDNEEARLIRSTITSAFQQRMDPNVDDSKAWWAAPVDFTATTSRYGGLSRWVLSGRSVRIRAGQLALLRGTSAVSTAHFDGGFLNIVVDETDRHLVVANATFGSGGLDVMFGGLGFDMPTVVDVRDSQFFGGRISFDEPNKPALNRRLVFTRCHFSTAAVVLPQHCGEYEIHFEDCTFQANPFPVQNQIWSAPRTLEFSRECIYSGMMEGFEARRGQELFDLTSEINTAHKRIMRGHKDDPR